MPLGDPYASLAELKARLRIVDTDDDDALTGALAAASRAVNQFCQRQFQQGAEPSGRLYQALTSSLLLVDDFYSTDGLEIGGIPHDVGDFVLEPLGGVVDGEPGWPWWRIRGSRFSGTVTVTARWGWAEVPGSVIEATLITAMEIFKMKDAPFGVQGMADFGLIRIRDNARVTSMLAPYRRRAAQVA
jgi:hypothetical protein